MIVKIYNDSPNEKILGKVVELLENDGVIIYPTDSVYALGCSIRSTKAIERLKSIKGKATDDLAIVCEDIKRVAEYVKLSDDAFRILKENTPGAFTFILKASSHIPERTLQKRKTIGVRIPDNAVARAIVSALGLPMITSSLTDAGVDVEYTTNPELIHELYGEQVAVVVDGGVVEGGYTSIVDFSGDEIEIIREGKSELIC